MSDFYSTVRERFADWNYGHPLILHGFIRAMKPQVIVEVGLYRAFAACWMARALQENNTGRLYAIDNFTLTEHSHIYGDPRTHAESNLKACGVDGWVEIIEGNSDEVEWPEQVDVCYVDAWHSYTAAKQDFFKAVERGAYLIALDDTENCVGPRMLVEELRRLAFIGGHQWDVMDAHSDNGMTLFLKRQPRRLITFSQELPFPNPGVDLRPLTLEEQRLHFAEATLTTGVDYSPILKETEHI